MPTYLSLLRGINVGWHHKIKMDALKEIYTQLSHSHVTTYIQTGNVRSMHPDVAPIRLAEQISEAIYQHYWYTISVLVITPQQLVSTIVHNPFPDATQWDPRLPYVGFLSELPPPEKIDLITPYQKAGEDVIVTQHSLYMTTPHAGSSKLTTNLFEKLLACTVTIRNRKTVLKLHKIRVDRTS